MSNKNNNTVELPVEVNTTLLSREHAENYCQRTKKVLYETSVVHFTLSIFLWEMAVHLCFPLLNWYSHNPHSFTFFKTNLFGVKIYSEKYPFLLIFKKCIS